MNISTSIDKTTAYFTGKTSVPVAGGARMYYSDGTPIDSKVRDESIETVVFDVAPDTWRYLPSRAFSDMSALKKIDLPDWITSIGSHAFDGCTSLVDVTFPSSLVRIRDWAFSNCRSLVKIDLSKCTRLEYINHDAFINCSALKEVILPSTLQMEEQEIRNAFRHCSQLDIESLFSAIETDTVGYYDGETLTFSDGREIREDFLEKLTEIVVTDLPSSISSHSFKKCVNVKEITIPENITEIEERAFDWSGIARIILKGLPVFDARWADGLPTPSVHFVPELDYEYTWEDIYSYSSNKELWDNFYYEYYGIQMHGSVPTGLMYAVSDLEFPDVVEKVPANFAEANIDIQTVTLPHSLKVIEKDAFKMCPNLEEVDFSEVEDIRALEIKDGAFSCCYALERLTGLSTADRRYLLDKYGEAFVHCYSLIEI